MREQDFNNKKSFYVILILTLSILMLGNLINKIIFFVFGLFCWGIVYADGKKIYNHELAILRMLILSIPLSFTDIFGQAYGTSILSWFNIFLLIIIITYISRHLIAGKTYFNSLSLLSILLLGIMIVPVIKGANILEGLKQYINSMTLFLLIILGNNFKYNLLDRQIYILKTDYILATIISSIGVIIQTLFVKILNITIGNYAFLGGYRHAYGFLFADYSFLSLYLVSGAMMLYFAKEKYTSSKTGWIFNISLLLITSTLTSARTGIVSFIVIFATYSLFNLLKLINSGSVKAFLIIIVNIVIASMGYLLVGRTRSIAKFSSSGRGELNIRAFEIFLDNPYSGIGFGSGNYMGMLPHNLFFQSLAQGGLLYTIPLILFLITMILVTYKKDIEMLPVLLCVLFGSLFIPNIFNSRFLPVLALLISIKE